VLRHRCRRVGTASAGIRAAHGRGQQRCHLDYQEPFHLDARGPAAIDLADNVYGTTRRVGIGGAQSSQGKRRPQVEIAAVPAVTSAWRRRLDCRRACEGALAGGARLAASTA
jgi:hypothetical protein